MDDDDAEYMQDDEVCLFHHYVKGINYHCCRIMTSTTQTMVTMLMRQELQT